MTPVVRYEERGPIAIITLNRPERLNTLTDEVVQGVAGLAEAVKEGMAMDVTQERKKKTDP